MEKEQIIKALKCCSSGHTATTCIECPLRYEEGTCDDDSNYVMIQALSLILEQEKRIEELEKEAAFREGEADNAIDIAESNIRDEIASGGTSCHWCEDKIKADTVRKMQEELKKTFSALCKGEMGDLFRIIDQIAKGMLEEKNERST